MTSLDTPDKGLGSQRGGSLLAGDRAIQTTMENRSEAVIDVPSRMLSRPVVIMLRLAIIGIVLAAWEFGAGNPNEGFVLVDDFYVGHPSKAWDALVRWQSEGGLWGHIYITLKETLTGFALGCSAGIVVGFVLGSMPRVGQVFSPLVVALQAVPPLALAPLFILWFGLGSASKVALVTLVVFFLVFYNTLSGVRLVDRDLLNVLRVMGATRRQLHWRVTAPSVATWVITGLRVSVAYAFVAAVVGQILASRQGLGLLIQRANSQFNPSAMFAAIAIIVAMALVLNGVVSLLERWVLRWRSVAGDSSASML